MEVLPVDLEDVLAIFLGMMIVLIPIAGLTARFALKPLVESMARLFENRTVEDTVQITERRVSLLEQQLEGLEGAVRDLSAKLDFDHQLTAASPERRLPDPGVDPSGASQ